jgi:hypothetical protein
MLVSACNGCKKHTVNIKIPDHYEPAKIMRFEKELFSIDTNQTEIGLEKLYQKYGIFYLSYARDLMALKDDKTDSLFIKSMSMVVKYKPFRLLENTVDSAFTDMKNTEDELGLATAIYKQEFPKRATPHYVTFISEYAYANVTYDSVMCIGLDMYMNETLGKFYRALEFPEFMIRKLRREYVVPNTIKALGISQFEEQTIKDKRFIATMIFEGKVRYFMNALLPYTADTIILGYTAEQLKWCYENEGEVWAHFIEKDLLYKDEQSTFMRYFNDGPFTSADGVPPESAPAIGVFEGWQIVKKYMKENSSVTLEELMNETDFEKILKQSKYRP